MSRLVSTTFTLAICVAVVTADDKTFYTSNALANMRYDVTLPNGVITPTTDSTVCQAICSQNDNCDAYAYSSFHKTCQIYQRNMTVHTVFQNSYKLWVLLKSSDKGYMLVGTDYLLPVYEMKNAADGTKRCKNEGGDLVAIKSQDMNDYITQNISLATMASYFFIGLSDEVEEGKWLYPDGSVQGDFDSWAWNGMWERRDKNCAIIGLNGMWKHENCGNVNYFICQIPIF
ncbi:C-type lectin domain family 4 member M [Hyalella azteca]|uniref:C-type lectin domain family 4 member M n=1 Tax=Hyalella azteca TaxID=294128 RepID=A0A8B7NU23_HYAAZ|nr:C-type lectin domain family 4 member M [Hyalella azteca]